MTLPSQRSRGAREDEKRLADTDNKPDDMLP